MSEGEIRKQAITRLVLLLLFPMGLWAWEMQSLPGKKASMASLQDQLSQLVAVNENAKRALENIKTYEAKQKVLKTQIEMVESLRRDRFQEVKVLDTIQKITPSKVWLQKIDFSFGKISIIGYAMTDIALTSFLDAMARSSFLKDVSLIRSNEQAEESTGLTVKRFEVSCGMEIGQ